MYVDLFLLHMFIKGKLGIERSNSKLIAVVLVVPKCSKTLVLCCFVKLLLFSSEAVTIILDCNSK